MLVLCIGSTDSLKRFNSKEQFVHKSDKAYLLVDENLVDENLNVSFVISKAPVNLHVCIKKHGQNMK